MILKPFDVVLVFVSLITITLFFINTLSSDNSISYVKVEVEGKEYLYPLDRDETEVFNGSLGTTTVEIKDGSAAIIDSACTNKTCIQIGEINKNGESSACLPNRVLVTIIGKENSEVDVLAY